MQICWYLAAVVQVQLCKYFIEIGDTSRESTVWGEINALRFAMMAYGNKSPIGSTSLRHSNIHIMLTIVLARQEKLLQGIMQEIIRMTNQPEPLTSGVPLYPFSHATLFSKEATSQNEVPAPIPGVRSFELDALAPHEQLQPLLSVAAQMSDLLPGPHQQHPPHPLHGQDQAHAGDVMGVWAAPRAAAGPNINMNMNMNMNESHNMAHIHAHAHARPAILSGTSFSGGF